MVYARWLHRGDSMVPDRCFWHGATSLLLARHGLGNEITADVFYLYIGGATLKLSASFLPDHGSELGLQFWPGPTE